MKPENIFLVRHGQSQGNVDRAIYKDVPDYALQLTKLGHEQAKKAGETLRGIVYDSGVQFYVSPFWRTRQTYAGIRKSFEYNSRYKYYEDPRLREQEWGQRFEDRSGYRDNEEIVRDSYGHFYYRFAGGESCADVFDRVSDFMGTMNRDFQKKYFPPNVIVVTHGMTMRLFIMRWFHCSVEEFETWGNPKNCEFYHLSRHDDETYELVTPIRKHILKHSFQFPWEKCDEKMFSFPHKIKNE
jgi:broad specificity phosphatase PhoE